MCVGNVGPRAGDFGQDVGLGGGWGEGFDSPLADVCSDSDYHLMSLSVIV